MTIKNIIIIITIHYGNVRMEEMIQKLTAPWNKKEIKWRVGSLNKNKDKALPLAYIDARVVMERLDGAVGIENWQDRYEFHGSRIICYLSIKINNEWICKSDGAGDSAVEAEKGGISDAFKRAAVKWGMGRELYELKCRWMPINEFKQLVGDPWSFVINNSLVGQDINDLDKMKAKKLGEKITTGLKIQESPDSCLLYWNDQINDLTYVRIINQGWADMLQKRFEDRMEELRTAA